MNCTDKLKKIESIESKDFKFIVNQSPTQCLINPVEATLYTTFLVSIPDMEMPTCKKLVGTKLSQKGIANI